MLRVVREILAPLICADGGEIFLVKAEDDVLELHLGGRYTACPGGTLATRRFIEPAVLAVAPDAQVKVTWGGLIPAGAELVGPAPDREADAD